MHTNNQNITLVKLLQSLEDDFDTKERKRIFEELKKINPTNEALLGAKTLLEANNWDYKALKNAINKTEDRIEKAASNTKKTTNNNYFKYAAVLLPIAFVLGYLINNTIYNKESIEKFYTREDGLPNYMGTEKNNWYDLMKPYRANKMKDALSVSQEILDLKPQNDTAVYFHGVISYEMKNYKIAKKYLLKIAQKKESIFHYDAVFRLGFVLNNLQEYQMAKQQFETVTKDSNNPFNEKAKEILEQLEK